MPLFAAPVLSGIAGAITLAASSPSAPAVGLYTSLPVSVVSCEQSSFSLPAMLETPSAPIHLENLSISFVNRAALQATNVRFAVTTPRGTERVEDVGRFDPGARIAHDFSPGIEGQNFADATKCAVESVTFSDGSSWKPAA